MEDLFNLEPEKYWDFTKKYSPEEKKKEIEKAILSDEYIASLKKDGYYVRFVKQNGRIAMQTRTISKVTGTYGDKVEVVPHIIKDLDKLPDGTILIGELYYPGKTSAQAGEILQCKTEKALSRQAGEYGYLHYYIHDIWFWDNIDVRDNWYDTRIVMVQSLDGILGSNEYIEIAEYAENPEEISIMLNYAFENDEEGIVMVRKDAIVEEGKRTAWKTIKVKKELQKEVDCFFTGNYKPATREYTGKDIVNWKYWQNIRDGKLYYGALFDEYENGRNYEPVTQAYYCGWAGSIEIGLLKDGKIVQLGYLSGLPNEIKESIVEKDNPYIMRPCTVTGMEFTDDNKIRHPKFVRFRDDLSIEDCTWEKVFG